MSVGAVSDPEAIRARRAVTALRPGVAPATKGDLGPYRSRTDFVP